MSADNETEHTHQLVDKTGDATARPAVDLPHLRRPLERARNELYRANLAAGQTGLSIAFDLPTQCGYDADHPLARPEVGKVGVPIASLDDMHALFDGIPIEQMNTSMTINGTAMWLLALYVALARERGVDPRQLCAARPRTTSSRSTSRAARTSSRPSRRSI